MSFLSRLGLGNEPATFHTNYYGQSSAVAWVDPSNLQLSNGVIPDVAAYAVPTWFRGVTIITDVAGQLPMRAHRGGMHSDQLEVVEPELINPQPRILVDPSPYSTRAEVVRYLVNSLVMRGNAYAWLNGHNAEGYATMMVPVNPDEVSVRWAKNGVNKVYEWRGTEMVEGFDFLHIKLMGLLNEPTGIGPLQAAALTLGYSLDAMQFGGDFFKGSATPAGVIEHPGRLDEGEAEKLRIQWEAQHNGGRGTGVLSGGIKYAPISITPEQAQFLATRAFDNQQIATILGIPQHLLNAGQPAGTASSLTYTNLQMILNEFYRMTLGPTYMSRIEDGLTRVLPRGQSVRFDTSELLRADDATRWAGFKVALDSGILTMDEVREMEGREPLPERERPQGIVDRRAQGEVISPDEPAEPEPTTDEREDANA